ncbi:MAG: hypothetical protein U5K69_24995 [Balneolaceae bacterium]|nr:hypothetical protein [Balneolaceae bacterium]
MRALIACLPCIEVDTTHMSDLKTTFLKSTGRMNPYLTIHRHPAQSRRHASLPLDDFEELDPGRKTIIIAEGFFDYLESSHAESILKGLASFFRNDAIMMSTIFALDQLSAPRRVIFKAAVRMVGERIKLELSKEEFETLVDSTGFSKQLLEYQW